MANKDDVSESIILVLQGDFGDSYSQIFKMTRYLVGESLTILQFSEQLVSLCRSGYIDGLMQRNLSRKQQVCVGKVARVTRTNANSLFYRLTNEGERQQIAILDNIRKRASHFPHLLLRPR